MSRMSQAGSTLVVSMIMLVVLMLLGVMSMSTSDTAYKLAGNLQFENNALNNAEAALSDVENSLKNGGIDITNPDFAAASMAAASSGFYPLGADALSIVTWVDADSVATDTGRRIVQLMSTDTVQLGENYIDGVPQSSACNKVNTYVITSRGLSARGSVKFVRSYYSVLTPC